jgi:hypothetical protein
LHGAEDTSLEFKLQLALWFRVQSSSFSLRFGSAFRVQALACALVPRLEFKLQLALWFRVQSSSFSLRFGSAFRVQALACALVPRSEFKL